MLNFTRFIAGTRPNIRVIREKDNALFDLLRCFSSVTKERTEVIFQGTRNLTIIPDHEGGIWEEYQFQCKPGDPKRRPCVISPYHYRLDWLMWFAAFQVSMLLMRLLAHVLWSSRLKFVSPEVMSLRVLTKNFGRRNFGFVRHISPGEMTFGRLDWLPWRKGGLARVRILALYYCLTRQSQTFLVST